MIRLFIEKHNAVFAFSVLIVIMGVLAYTQLPRESTPEIQEPYIFVTTSYIGASAGDVEALVTEPIEKELDGMAGLDELTSESRQNFSSIFASFTSDVDVETALRRVKDRVDLAKAKLPDGADEPFVKELSVSDWPFFVVSLSHPSGVEGIEAAAERLNEKIERLPGVIEVDVSGDLQKEVAIDVDPARLDYYGLSLRDVQSAVQAENTSIPGGRLQNTVKNFDLAVTGEITDPAQFEQIYVTDNDVRVRLADIGTARFQDATPETYSRLNADPAITLGVKKRLGANILTLTEEIEGIIDRAVPTMPPGTEVVISYDESIFIEDMIADLENNMFTGFVLVMLVTIFFLGLRNSLFVSLAIPFSMLMSFFVLQLMGVTLNMIVLFSLILALGMLVDNGIVIVENIFRHGGLGKSRKLAAMDGSREVAAPIVASTITTCLAFLPIIFMPGIMGDIMAYLPITVIVVLACSLFVALAINPVFCAQFLRISEKHTKRMNEGSSGFAKLQAWYTAVLGRVLRRPLLTAFGVLTLVAGGFVLYANHAADVIFFPYIDPERARVSIEAPAGTPLHRTDQLVREVETLAQESPASLRHIEATTGRYAGTTASNRGTVEIIYKPYKEREIKGETAVRALRERLATFTGGIAKIEEASWGPPSGDDVSYQISGSDYAVMGEIAESLRLILEEYEGFREVETNFEASQPQYDISIDRGKAAFYGLSTRDVADTIRTAVNGSTIGEFRHGGEEYDIVLRYVEEARNSLEMLRSLAVVSNDGTRIPLSMVADIEPNSSVSVIKRRDLQRAVSIWANFDPAVADRGQILAEVEGRVEQVKASLPEGYLIGTGAGFDERNESTEFLGQAFIFAIFLIMVVLIAQFNSITDPIIIMLSVLMSVGGVLWGFFLSGENFVIIMSGIGCIALAGVVVNNSIVLVDYIHKLIRGGMGYREAIIEAGRTRLRPVVLTALTTVLALVPMAFGFSFDVHSFRFIQGSESAEFWKAFSWTMLYGLTFATVMTLIVLPALQFVKYRVRERRGWTGD